MPELQLYDIDGQRLYLNDEERRAFYDAAMDEPGELRTFCHTLHDTGVRISEALALRPSKVDFPRKSVAYSVPEEARKSDLSRYPGPRQLSRYHGIGAWH